MESLKSVRDVIRVTEVEIRRVENGSNHGQIGFILLLLAFAEVEHRWNVWDNIDSGQTPNDLVVDESDCNAMCCNHQVIARSQRQGSQNATNLANIVRRWDLICFD